MKVYLEKPIYIKGIEIGHTQAGLEFMISHYQKMLTYNPVNTLIGKARSQKDEEYMKLQLENYKQHLELYKSQEVGK